MPVPWSVLTCGSAGRMVANASESVLALPLCFRKGKGLEGLSSKPLKLLVEPDGLEPTTATMPL